MDIEKAFEAIKEWYEGDSFQIIGLTIEPKGSSEDFEQSEHFLSVVGYQNPVGMGGDIFVGSIYFEYEKGKFIVTDFWC